MSNIRNSNNNENFTEDEKHAIRMDAYFVPYQKHFGKMHFISK